MKTGLRWYLLAGTSFVALAVAAPRAQATTFTYTGAVQSFTVPTTSNYQITAFGAQGGNDLHFGDESATGGLGSEVGGTINLNAGEVLNIYVGGAGVIGYTGGGGGGGGSVVSGPPPPTGGSGILVAAGGGGGANGIGAGGGGQFGNRGAAGGEYFGGAGGSGDGGGGAGGVGRGTFTGQGGGGGSGLYGAGGNAGDTIYSGYGGNFPAGGRGYIQDRGGPGNGGFGGGGGGGLYGGGGGGGWSGGGGGFGINGGGGGGGSITVLDNFFGQANFQAGNGEVVITELSELLPPEAAVPEPPSVALLGASLAGLLALSRRRRWR